MLMTSLLGYRAVACQYAECQPKPDGDADDERVFH
jgi:hypothetical protein